MQIRFFAAAAEAAGVDSLDVDATGLTPPELTRRIAEGNPALEKVLSVSSLLADGARVDDDSTDLTGVSSLDVLPPFAGG